MENNIIWFRKSLELPSFNSVSSATMGEYLGMEWAGIGPDFLSIKMPVDHRTHQPFGLLHGGASCALAETVGSIASYMVIDPEKFISVGLEINANHVRGIKSGYVTGTARPLHLGGSTHVWDIKITNEAGELICVSRLTVAILEKRDQLIG